MESAHTELSLTTLLARFPCRQQEITKLWSLIRDSWGPIPHTLLYGVSGVGKTAIVRAVVEALQVRHAYICCTHSSRPQQVQQSILSQLKASPRTQDAAYATGVSVEHTADFIQQLGGLCPCSQAPAVIIIDRAEIAASSSWLPALLRARQLCDEGISISVILISQHAWGSGTFLPFGRFYALHLKAYTEEELEKVLLAMASVPAHEIALYSIFVQNVIVTTFSRLTRHCKDLHQLAIALYPLYKQDADQEPADLPLDRLHRRLYGSAHFQKAMTATLKTYQPGCPVQLRMSQLDKPSLDFELSLFGKWLLLAAYIASRNKPTLDRQVFDGSARSGKLRGRRGRAMDLQADAAAEALMKGPHWFPLRRLMLIHDALLRSCGMTDLQNTTEEEEDSIFLAAAATLTSINDLGRGQKGTLGKCQNQPTASPLHGPSTTTTSGPPMFSPSGKRFRTTSPLVIPDEDDDIRPSPRNPVRDPPAAGRPQARERRSLGTAAPDSRWKPKGLQPQDEHSNMLSPSACSFYHQLSSLVHLRFLSQGGEDVVEGPKYYCTISDEVAQQIALILKVDLAKYIRYR